MGDPAVAEATLKAWESALNEENKKRWEGLKRDRRSGRSKVSKAVTLLNDILAEDSAEEEDIEVALGGVKDTLVALEEVEGRIWNNMQGKDDTETEALIDADRLLGKKWTKDAYKAIAKGQKALKALRPPPSVPTAPHHPAHTPAAHVAEVKLPKVELPKFEGKSPSEYQGFISTFDSMIHASTTIDDVRKLIYLKGCCVGKAKEIADGFTVTSDNYKELYAVLKAAYGLPRLVLQAHANKILDLEPFKVSGVAAFTNSLETALRSMAEYKVQAEALAPLLVPLVERLMPREILAKWREEIHDEECFSTKALLEFLHERIQCYPQNASQEKKEEKKDPSTKEKAPKTTSTSSETTDCKMVI